MTRSAHRSLTRVTRVPLRMTRAWARAAVVASLAVTTAWSSSAIAQPLDKDADAERLFREGQKLMEDRRYGEACPKFEAAYRKDQQLGTLLNLAYCHKEQGAIWQAWLEFKEAEVKAIELKRTDRKDFARQRMAELEKQLGKVVVEVQQRVELTEVLVEDRRVPEAEKGQTFAVETGQRKFIFRAKGKKQAVQLVTINKSATPQRVSVPEMGDQPKEAPPPPPDSTRSSDEPKAAPAVAAPQPDGSTQRVAGLAIAGVGLVGIGIGSVTGLMTFSNPCKTGAPCSDDERASGRLTSTVSNISFVAGAVLFAGGLLTFFLAPSAKATARGQMNVQHAERPVRLFPELGAGWAGVRGVF
jgi:hypothetical protein